MPRPRSFHHWLLTITAVSVSFGLTGCRTVAPIFVWRPPQIETQPGARLALAPIVAYPELAMAIEAAMLVQRPAARADLAVLTAEQLLEAAPVRLASTLPLANDLAALHASRTLGADILLCGEVYSCELDWAEDLATAQRSTPNLNQTFFQRLGLQTQPDNGFHILMSWNVMEVATGRSLGSRQFQLHSHEIPQRYPDLQAMADEPAAQLLHATAREAWKTLAPVVEKSEVRLATPWLQPGSWQVRRGVRAAKQGQWQLAEQHWQRVADRWWLPTPAAHHNLAIAMAAREDFDSARRTLQQATGPLSIHLPDETLVWLDHNQRWYHAAHRLERPQDGWAFPEPEQIPGGQLSVPTVNESELPWLSLPTWGRTSGRR